MKSGTILTSEDKIVQIRKVSQNSKRIDSFLYSLTFFIKLIIFIIKGVKNKKVGR